MQILHLIVVQLRTVNLGQRKEEVPVGTLGFTQRNLLGHIDGLLARIGLVLGRANTDAKRATRAIFRCDGERVELIFLALPLRRDALEGCRSLVCQFRREDLGADHTVRANHRALAALDADVFIPDWNEGCNVALFVLRGSGRKGATGGQCADRKQVTLAVGNLTEDVADELRRIAYQSACDVEVGVRCGRNRNLFEIRQGRIDSREVLRHDCFAALAVGLLDRLLDLLDRLILGQHARDGKEAGLHDGVHARTHAGVASHLAAVDDVEGNLLLDDLVLNGLRQVVPDLRGRIDRVQQEGRTFDRRLQNIHLLKEGEVVAGDKAGARNQIRGADRSRTEAQVRGRHRARLLRVIHEVALRVIRRLGTDDLDRVLVGTNRAVRAQAVEQRAVRLHVLGREAVIVVQAGEGHVVVDTDREVNLRRQAVASANHRRSLEPQGGGVFRQHRDHVLIERLTGRTRLLATIKNGNRLDRLRQ